MSDIIKVRNGNSWIGVPSMAGPKGDKGDTGERGPSGHGLPSGGNAGEVLRKKTGADYDYEWTSSSGEAQLLSDVQINGTTVVSDGIANIPLASSNDAGVVKVDESYGFIIDSNGELKINAASDSNIKQGTNSYRPVASNHIQEAAFYGLAKAAGDTTQASSSNTLGTYTEEAKTAIKNMLGVDAVGIMYGTCDTAYGIAAKVATVSNFHTLTTGVTVTIKFTYYNSATNPTLNVNDTGAYAIKTYGTNAAGTVAKTSWNSGSVLSLTFDGTYWMLNNWLNTEPYVPSTPDAMSLGFVNVKQDDVYDDETGDPLPYTSTVTKVDYVNSPNIQEGSFFTVEFTYNIGSNAVMYDGANYVQDYYSAIYYKGSPITADTLKPGDIALFQKISVEYYIEDGGYYETIYRYILITKDSGGLGPTITTTPTANGHDITITDANGTNTISLTNGANGSPGYTPVKGTDYWTNAERAAVIQDAIDGILTIYPSAEDNSY